MVKVTFIGHSCYFIELEEHCLLFDYFQGDVPETGKPLYVFASHSHDDHFSPRVFSLGGQSEKRAFILSDDISPKTVPEDVKDLVLFVSPHRTCETGGVKIATLKSTDAGVAFLVQCEGKLLYHAGDLNCWVWDGAPRFQNDLMEDQYRRELDLLAGKDIDAAFVPLDPRQGDNFDLGMRYFFQAARAKHVFPMHMWGDYSVVPLFKSDPTCREYAGRVMDVDRPGKEFVI